MCMNPGGGCGGTPTTNIAQPRPTVNAVATTLSGVKKSVFGKPKINR